jgi:hypothetical protein
MGPLLQPEICEKQATLKPVDVTDEFLWGAGHCGADESIGVPGL